MRESRSLVEVLDKILAVIPAGGQERLIKRLQWHRKDALYKAPEQQGQCWLDVSQSLFEYVPAITEEWHTQIQEIFLGG